jgi:GYF domain 2
MPVQWYYGRGADITGPVSGRELSDLAASGEIVPTDTVWQEGVEAGVAAGKVKNLFRSATHRADRLASAPATPAPDVALAVAPKAGDQPGVMPLDPPAAAPDPEAGAEVIPTDPVPTATEVPPTAGWSTTRATPKTARAVAGKGVVIVGQDGATVKYRMKCTTCGREDSSWKSIPIPRGVARVAFFCSKCRKRRDVEIHGIH